MHRNKSQNSPRSELSLTLAFICHRQLFGHVYRNLQSDYFYEMPYGSGVAIGVWVPTRRISPLIQKPGDIDLLIVPYNGGDLILDRTLAVEVKIVRASFADQGRSPNDYGFSQAEALWSLGIPYVAVMQLIISDVAPRSAWKLTTVARVLDGDGRVELLPRRQRADLMPGSLMDRSYGRLKANSPREQFGLASVYLRDPEPTSSGPYRVSRNMWFPSARRADRNPKYDHTLTERIADLFVAHSRSIMITPRYDPI